MAETRDLSTFIKKQEYKLQAKIYARKYERLAGLRRKEPEPIKLANNEFDYHYRADDGVWLERPTAKNDQVLAAYELKFWR